MQRAVFDSITLATEGSSRFLKQFHPNQGELLRRGLLATSCCLCRFGMTPFRSTWLALLWLLRCLEVNLLPLGIDSIQATFWASMNLGHLIGSNRLLSPLFKH